MFGILHHCVTGVHTCALAISACSAVSALRGLQLTAYRIGIGAVFQIRGGIRGGRDGRVRGEIGRASCRERVYVAVVPLRLKGEVELVRKDCGEDDELV